jgi:hypothetical protein
MKQEHNTMYTVQRITKDGRMFGSVHGSTDGDKSLCGRYFDGHNWSIITNDFTGEITCSTCLKVLKLREGKVLTDNQYKFV